MRRARLFWKLFLGNAAIVGFVVLASVWAPRFVLLLFGLALAAGFAVLCSRRMTRLTSATQAIARGEFSTKLPLGGSDEVALLARSIQRLRDRLGQHQSANEGQRKTLESLLAELNEGIVVVRDDGRIVMANRAAARMLGHVRPPLDDAVGAVGLNLEQFLPQHALQRLVLAPRPPPVSVDGGDLRDSSSAATAVEVETPRGTTHVLARVCDLDLPARGDDGGTAKGRLLILADVTERQRALRLRTDFVANASHELRTPLSAIRAAVETLGKMDFAAESAHAPRFVDVIARHVARLEALVGDLLDLSRLESAAGRFQPTDLWVHRIGDELRSRWADMAQAKSLRWDVQAAEDCPILRSSPELLRMVLDNLVDNAMKFTGPGGAVTVRARQDGNRVVLEVSDTGCGIPESEQERVFERFYQVTPSRSGTGSLADVPRGTGLGLAIVRHAVTAMGGSVGLESEPSRGTCVRVVLPCGDARSASAS